MIAITKNPKKYNEFKVVATMTLGKVLALRNALSAYAACSSVGNDLLCELNNELYKKGINDESTL